MRIATRGLLESRRSRTLGAEVAVLAAGVLVAGIWAAKGFAEAEKGPTPPASMPTAATPAAPSPAAPLRLPSGPAASPPRPTIRPTDPPTGSIRVSVAVTGSDRKLNPVAGAVVWLPGSAAAARPAGNPQISSKGKRFEPRIAAVSAGTTVDFPNLDKIHHNVFSLSPAASFDLGLYKNGTSKPWTFGKPGLVKIYCNIHPQMAAYLMVVDGGLYAQTGADGTALLSGVPVGRRAVQIWEEKGGDWSGTVDVTAGAAVPLAVALDGTSWRDLPHKNKYGKDYPPPDDDENRY